MYAPRHNKDGSLKHSHECQMAFGRKDKECPRCQELIAGAAPRAGWQKDHYELKAYNDKIAAIPHACNGHCNGDGLPCTHGEW